MMAEITDPTAVSAVATDAIVVAPAPATSWFADWANQQGIQEFARLIEQAELTSFIESCETPLTIFVPTNEAIRAMAGNLPTEIQLLRELLCVHITMGSLSREELHTNRSITTIGQQTHHVQAPVEALHQPLQVGTMKLVSADIALPASRGLVHVVDCVMCCLRLLQHCRFEQVWNKTVKPSPKVGLQGSWQPVDELHAVLVHCDTWTPRFDGLRGNVVPLGPVPSSHGDRASRHFHENVVHYSELLIKEKPPEMSKKKRKKAEDGTATYADDGLATPRYRMMFSLYRREVMVTPINPNPVPGDEAPAMPEGKHLTFCMAPEDILIRNSFHMLTEAEKETRRAEYKSKQSAPKPKGSPGLGMGATAVGMMPGMGGAISAGAMALLADGSQLAGAMPQALVSSQHIELLPAAASAAAEPTGAGAPQIGSLSATTGHVAGGTPLWIQGSRFSTRTRVCFGSAIATDVHACNGSLITVVVPASPSGRAETVEVRLTHDGLNWSNPLLYTYRDEASAAEESAHMVGLMALLTPLVEENCVAESPDATPAELMDSSLPPALQLLGGVLSMLQSSGVSDLSRVDMHGRSLLHYACALRHAGAVKLLLAARADPRGVDVAGMSAADWARRTGFAEGEALIAQALANGDGAPPAAVAAVDSSMML
jgi:uncharacterized surface protein with fasciclin (FAS1) repeats